MVKWVEEQLRRLFPNEQFLGGGFNVPKDREFTEEEQEKVAKSNPYINLEDYSSQNSRNAEAVLDESNLSPITKLFSEVFSRYKPLPEKYNVDISKYLVKFFGPEDLALRKQNTIYPRRFEESRVEEYRPPLNYRDALIHLALRRVLERDVNALHSIKEKQGDIIHSIISPHGLAEKELESPKSVLHYQFLKEQMYLTELYKNVESLSSVKPAPSQPLSECDQLLLDMYTAPVRERLDIATSLQECIARTHCKTAYNKYLQSSGSDKDSSLDSLYNCVSSYPEYYYVREVQKKYSKKL